MTDPRPTPARMRNLGPVSRQWLAAIEVHSLDDLRAVGSVNAYRLLLLRGYPGNLNFLWAMEAALLDVHWLELPLGTKDRLRADLDAPWDPTLVMEL